MIEPSFVPRKTIRRGTSRSAGHSSLIKEENTVQDNLAYLLPFWLLVAPLLLGIADLLRTPKPGLGRSVSNRAVSPARPAAS